MKNVNWEPTTEAEWLAFLFLLFSLTDAYRTSIKMTSVQKAAIILAYNMLKEQMDNVDLIDQSKSEIIKYKTSLLEGPETTDMTAVPLPPVYETGAAICPGGIKSMLRAVRMDLLPNCTPAQATYLTFVKGEDPFVAKDSISKGKGVATIGNIEVTTGDVKNVPNHNLYARVTGTSLWIFIRTFSGAHYDYHRVPTTPNTPESVDMITIGVIDNVEIGHPSPTPTV